MSDAFWMQPIWQAPRPFVVTWIEVLWTPGKTLPDGTGDGARPPGTVNVSICAAEDPSVGPHAKFVVLATVATTSGTESEHRAVAEVPGIGPRVVKAGWWIGAFHDSSWRPWSGQVARGLTLVPHGTFV